MSKPSEERRGRGGREQSLIAYLTEYNFITVLLNYIYLLMVCNHMHGKARQGMAERLAMAMACGVVSFRHTRRKYIDQICH